MIISDQATASSNQFSPFTNTKDDISVTKIRENSEKLGLRQSNDNITKQLITTLNKNSKKIMVTDSKRQNNIDSNSKKSKNKNLSVIIGWGNYQMTQKNLLSNSLVVPLQRIWSHIFNRQ